MKGFWYVELYYLENVTINRHLECHARLFYG